MYLPRIRVIPIPLQRHINVGFSPESMEELFKKKTPTPIHTSSIVILSKILQHLHSFRPNERTDAFSVDQLIHIVTIGNTVIDRT